jgi:hypothetical protein
MIKWVPRIEVDLTPFNIAHLSLNPNAVDYLTEHPTLVNLDIFSNPNPDAVPLMRMKLIQMNDPNIYGFRRRQMSMLLSTSQNPGVMALLEEPEYRRMIKWDDMSENPAAIRLLAAHQEMYGIKYDNLYMNPKAEGLVGEDTYLTPRQLCFLARNQSQWAMEMIEPYLEMLNPMTLSYNLSENPFAVPLLEKYPQYLNVYSACKSPKAVHLIRPHLGGHEINWLYLSGNEGAVDILRANPEKINWRIASSNATITRLLWDDFKDVIIREGRGRCWQHPEMFVPVVDYQAIRDRPFSEVLKELMALYYHPSRMDPETFDLDGTKSVFSSKRKRSV